MPEATEVVFRAEDVHKDFTGGRGRGAVVHAVDGVSFTLHKDETLAVVGESGSGKSTLARTILRLIEPTSGRVFYHDTDILSLSSARLRDMRLHVQMVFQDPYASLHPRHTAAQIISEPWVVHPGIVDRKDRNARVRELLAQVGLPATYASLYPGRLSGGERQRIAIARALALQPEVLVLDEPVSALDVSIQAQVINLLMRLREEFGLAYVFISHDLALVRLVADRVAVMYMGRFVEQGTTEQVFSNPTHPYTIALLESSPQWAEKESRRADHTAIVNTINQTAPADVSVGCPFRPRCWRAQPRCVTERPELVVRDGIDHPSACHFAAASVAEAS